MKQRAKMEMRLRTSRRRLRAPGIAAPLTRHFCLFHHFSFAILALGVICEYDSGNNEASLMARAERHGRRRKISAAPDATVPAQPESEQAWLAAVVEFSSDAILSKALDGTITSWNAAAETMYGYPAAEVIGRSIEFMVPEDRLDELRAMDERLARGERVAPLETVTIDGDDVALQPSAALTLGLALHELATNAAEHGAVVSPSGSVEVRSEVGAGPGGRRLVLTWCERGARRSRHRRSAASA
jgi:PAS domain S-box-containing protein